jgi:putative acetyltransferase
MAKPALPAVALRPMLPNDAERLATIFVASIDELTSDDYTPSQQAAWAESAEDVDAFGDRLQGWLTLIASLGGVSVGFASLAGIDQFEMLYVAPEAAGQGVGRTLCDAIEKLAAARGAAVLRVDASDTAHDFFAHRGYLPKHRKTVERGDEWLGSTAMEKPLQAKTESGAS